MHSSWQVRERTSSKSWVSRDGCCSIVSIAYWTKIENEHGETNHSNLIMLYLRTGFATSAYILVCRFRERHTYCIIFIAHLVYHFVTVFIVQYIPKNQRARHINVQVLDTTCDRHKLTIYFIYFMISSRRPPTQQQVSSVRPPLVHAHVYRSVLYR